MNQGLINHNTHNATEALKLLRHQRKGILDLSAKKKIFGQKRTVGCTPNNPCLKKLGLHGGLSLRATRWYNYILGRFATSLPGSPQQPKLSECLSLFSSETQQLRSSLECKGGFYCWSMIMIVFIADQICCRECGNIVSQSTVCLVNFVLSGSVPVVHCKSCQTLFSGMFDLLLVL